MSRLTPMEQRALDRMDARAAELKREHHMITLRDEIAGIIERDTVVGIGLVDHRHEVGEVHDALPAADAILALLRERLLSDELFEQLHRVMVWHQPHDDSEQLARRVHDVFAAALDTTTENTDATT
jgi:hypothetical protein